MVTPPNNHLVVFRFDECSKKQLTKSLHLFFERFDYVHIDFNRFPLRVSSPTQRLQMELLIKTIKRVALGQLHLAPLKVLPFQKAPSLSSDLSKWMECLPNHVKRLPVNQLHFPGTHNTGSYMIKLNQIPIESPVMQVGEWAGNHHPPIKDLIADFSVFQNKTIKEQLKLGVRFLDLRYAYSDVAYASHEIAGPKLETIFQEIAEFLKMNQQEVLFISLKREEYFKFGNAYTDEAVMELVYDKIGPMLVKCGEFDESMCIEEMAKNNRRVILVDQLKTAKYKKYRWPWSTIDLPWKGTSSFATKVDYLSEDIRKHRLSQAKVNGVQFIATSKKLDILKNRETGQGYQSMYAWRSFMQEMLPEFLKQNQSLILQNEVALFTLDYPKEASIRFVVELNYRKPKPYRNNHFDPFLAIELYNIFGTI